MLTIYAFKKNVDKIKKEPLSGSFLLFTQLDCTERAKIQTDKKELTKMTCQFHINSLPLFCTKEDFLISSVFLFENNKQQLHTATNKNKECLSKVCK